MISAVDDDWLAVVRNLAKAQVVWRRLMRVFSKEVVMLRVSWVFLKVVVQSVLLFGAENWVVTPPAWAGYWGGFHNQVS